MVPKRASVRGVLVAPALAGWICVSELPGRERVVDCSATDALRGLPEADLDDCGNDL